MSDISQLGKKGEAKVKEWLDKPAVITEFLLHIL